ncbi:uncharacterized protein BO97DRAFT_189965 [Aspergillus homomorphus CBS 101889]|uniref:Uncharacterized protein n=1 Tax=Aspergillus homomorphus (strain CBS 101889) TaxID=1450537 RepID=A0A395HMM5_ASPHC|nr:hypothetical protein BO97DRAFT_189965 [Aspergillus homomorphus CBS 101889]RAL09087.1 hypothetical protein BO97DRAFT_189965 [Aspergillus homomorphus CBS 101889]
MKGKLSVCLVSFSFFLLTSSSFLLLLFSFFAFFLPPTSFSPPTLSISSHPPLFPFPLHDLTLTYLLILSHLPLPSFVLGKCLLGCPVLPRDNNNHHYNNTKQPQPSPLINHSLTHSLTATQTTPPSELQSALAACSHVPAVARAPLLAPYYPSLFLLRMRNLPAT